MIWLTSNITVIQISIIAFLVIIMLLVSILLFAKKKLTPQGEVTIDINDGEKTIETKPGSTLLSTLSESGLFLPSACGGGGTCGMCGCQIESGAGTILPTETGFFTRKEQQNNWRLGCQVKVKDNIKMYVPQEVIGKI
jgi:Na+-transporting NADH:ubiquinone oxidoreductase subunit F